MWGKRETRESLILIISVVGYVCDVGELSLLPSKNNIGIGRLRCEKWGERGGRGNYSRPISMHAALIKYSHRKLGLRSNASGLVPDRQPASTLRKLFGHADSNRQEETNHSSTHPSIHPWVAKH